MLPSQLLHSSRFESATGCRFNQLGILVYQYENLVDVQRGSRVGALNGQKRATVGRAFVNNEPADAVEQIGGRRQCGRVRHPVDLEEPS